MSKPAVSVQGLWKEYRIGGQRAVGETFYDVLSGALRRPFQGRAAGDEGTDGPDAAGPPGGGAPDRFWALRDVSFDIAPGEVVGIIGRNGAGKSTLLKILSRITAPTKGRVEVRGRLASLLEVGTGFHPELSGRENIYLNGAILGMTRRDIARKFDEIVAFAEVEKFIDTPVKRYSSGMYVRLAFAVAAHLDTDVLVVDEVLAVGDFSFQQRCMGKMRAISSDGRTVLFVSHNTGAVRRLCNRAVVLENGIVVQNGNVDTVVDRYLASERVTGGNAASFDFHLEDAAPVSIQRISLLDELGRSTSVFPRNTDVYVEIRVSVTESVEALCVGFDVLTPDGEIVLRSYHREEPSLSGVELGIGCHALTCKIQGTLLNQGVYFLAPLIASHQRYWIIEPKPCLRLEIESTPGSSNVRLTLSDRQWPGTVAPELRWTADQLARGTTWREGV